MPAMLLGEMLIEAGALTRAQLEQVLNAQSIYGGRLGTNLVEMGLIGEDQLASVLNQKMGVPCLDATVLNNIPSHILSLVPLEMVQRYHVVPAALEGKRLTLAMLDPSDFKATEEIGFVTGLVIVPRVCSELRLNIALERYYGIKRQVRYIPVKGGFRSRVSQAVATAGAQPVSAVEGQWEAQGPGTFMGGVGGEYLEPDFSVSEEQEENSDPLQHQGGETQGGGRTEGSPLPRASVTGGSEQGRTDGTAVAAGLPSVEPSTVEGQRADGPSPVQAQRAVTAAVKGERGAGAEAAEGCRAVSVAADENKSSCDRCGRRIKMEVLAERLAGAPGEAQVVSAVLWYLGGEFDRAAFLRLRSEMAVGVQAIALGDEVGGFAGYGVPLDQAYQLRGVVQEKRLFLGEVAAQGGAGQLMRVMGGSPPAPALVVPVALGGQVAGLICVNDHKGRLSGGVFELQRVVAMAELAFEMLRLRKRIIAS